MMDLHEADLKGRRLAQYMWDELEKISNVAQGAAPAPQAAEQQSGELQGSVQREVEGAEEASPAHGVVASRVEQLSDKKARAIPVINPPPGFVFAPELQSFVPDPNNPAWMEANQAAEAAKAQTFYSKGQQDLQNAQAQQELEQQVTQQIQAIQQQQAAAQQQQAAEQQAALAAPMQQAEAQAKEQAKAQAKTTMGGLQTPQAVSGAPQAASPQPQQPSAAQKGVTIRVGR
jgi:hypothetical protein